MNGARRLWGIGSPRTLRAHWMLHELGLDYETRAIIPRSAAMDDPELLRFTQRRKIPFFEDGEIRIGESGAIVFYLADRYRDRGGSRPSRALPRARAFEELAFFILMELDATALYVLRRHEGLPDVYGEAPEACAAARGYFQRMVGEIERRLADGRPHLLGDAFSAADCCSSAASPGRSSSRFRSRSRSSPIATASPRAPRSRARWR